MNAKKWISTLNLERHPEGGYYRELYHSDVWLDDESTRLRYGGERRSATSIYFLLESGDVSRFHRLKSDEIWYFHSGTALTVHVIAPDGTYSKHPLGLGLSNGEEPQICIPRNHIFGATVNATTPDDYAFVSCMVSPGFDFADFELFEQDDLLRQYPQHSEIIRRLTK
ncbi:cupin domain-containing protein [Alicyclobacillus dauci]|uniref:Cupin domain-containing protein n=1 Tax=Alicyclobacillus dauci TaxID=1475485 RepID=A0ABY6YZD5_9BACL|nr:cupin domain-containing protein [Alicyclobacillus dauci]WAH36000.1 cupin domain-containing protein [Alicyclobacillus dauci]